MLASITTPKERDDVVEGPSTTSDHRAKIHSTNLIERLIGEIKRRTEVVGIFPNEVAMTTSTMLPP
jgi:transposase-like protein